jgi:predicted esterase
MPTNSLRLRYIFVLVFGLVFGLTGGMINPCSGQVERYELGKRLRRFEEAWQLASPDLRLKSTPVLQQAVTSFFSLQLKVAAARLDQAWTAVLNRKRSDFERACTAYRIDLPQPILELPPENAPKPDRAQQLLVKIVKFYKSKESLDPAATRVLLECVDDKGQSVYQLQTSLSAASEQVKIPFSDFAVGDYLVRCRLTCNEAQFELLESAFSVVAHLDLQLADIERVQRDKTRAINGSVRATLGEYQNLMQQGREGFSLETDYPFCRILSLADRITKNPMESSVTIAKAAQDDDVWMVLTENRRRVPVRLRAPQTQSGKLPVLFLFHGAGGSENMFFETYGYGQAVKMGLDRGWLVVAPRQGLMGLSLDCNQMLTALEPFFEIDRSQVYLLGHSMGAAQVIQQVGLNPDLPAAAAAIGGGRPPRDAKKIASVPWFVAAGELDFGRGGAKSFHQSLIKAGASNASYAEYPGIEHLVIVQAALPQTFEFFDRIGDTSQN